MDYKVKDGSHDRKYFTIIPNYILNHSPATAQALYLQMKRVAGEDGVCFITQKNLCKRLGIGKVSLRKTLDYLLKHKWIDFIGSTPSKTRPIDTYKINDIWKLNVNFYDTKKISSKIALSSKQKDKTQNSPKIRPKTDPIRRTIIKKNNQREAKASGLMKVGTVLEGFETPKPTKGGAKYSWQDTAVRWWKKLGLGEKPTASWFKHFRDCASLMERACAWASDSNGEDLEKLTYWALARLKKHGKIVYDK